MTNQQLLLKQHLSELGIETVAEYRFSAMRFRFDLANERLRIGFEVDGQFKGRHGGGWAGGHDYPKDRLAQYLGWKVLRFSNREVEDGSAKAELEEWLSR